MKSFAYTLKNPMGLHMRPAGAMVEHLAPLGCDVTLRCGARSANAKSILNVMALAARCGEAVTVEVSGENEEEVAAQLQHFFEENF